MTSEPIREELPLLRPGDRIERTLTPEASTSFRVTLDRGDWIELVATQQGLDVALELFPPEGKHPVLSIDSPIGREGDERLVAVARSAGDFRVTVRTAEPQAPPGRFVLQIVSIHTATDREEALAEAEARFAAGENLRRKGTEASRRQAFEAYEEARKLWSHEGDVRRTADTTHRMGWVTDGLGDKRAAVALYEEALALYRQAQDRCGEAMLLNYLGGTLYLLGELDEALRRVRDAIAILENPGPEGLEAPSLMAGCLDNLGKIHRRKGETAEALAAFRQALTLAEARDDRLQKALLLGNLGVLLLSQNLLDSAEDRLRQAAETWRILGKTGNQGSIWNYLGDVAKRRAGEAVDDSPRRTLLAEALAAYSKAHDLRIEAGDQRGEAIALDSIATIHLLLEDYEEAQNHYEAAREIYDRLDLHADATRTIVNLGRLHQLRGDFELALRTHQEAEPAVAELGDPQLTASNLYGMTRALWSLNRLDDASRQAEKLLGIVENLRESTQQESLKVAFFASKQQYFELSIDILMSLAERGHDTAEADAFAIAERRRSRMLLDLLGEERNRIHERAPVQLLDRERRLQDELNRIADSEQPGGASIRRLRDDLEAVRSAIRDAAPDDLFRRAAPVDLAAARQLATGPQTQLLVYSLGESRSYLWLISEDGVESRILESRRVIEAAAMEAYEALQSESQSRAERNHRRLQNLASLVLDPVADDLTARRLVIVPDGALLNIPFGALPMPDSGAAGSNDRGRELIRSHELVHLPSVSVLRSIRQRRQQRGAASELLLIVANPRFAPPGGNSVNRDADDSLVRSMRSFGWDDLPPLPGTQAEADAIRSLARGEMLTLERDDATKAKFLATDLSRFQILHIATHALVHRDHPELSGLVFSRYDAQGRQLDGYLRLHEIYNLDLAAELVVLSACSTAIGPRVRGEGILGLSRAFLYAGSSRMVISHWNIGDTATVELMRRFYWAVLELGLPPAAALRAAQVCLLESGDPSLSLPVAWASFTFQGDWRLDEIFDRPIEGAAVGNPPDDGTDIDYPNPDDALCDSFTEPWQKEICRWIQKLAPRREDQA